MRRPGYAGESPLPDVGVSASDKGAFLLRIYVYFSQVEYTIFYREYAVQHINVFHLPLLFSLLRPHIFSRIAADRCFTDGVPERVGDTRETVDDQRLQRQ